MSEVSIDILNDDSLLHILELLTFKERVNVELVCKRWHRLCRQLWKYTQKLGVGIRVPQYCSFYKPILEPPLKLCNSTNLKTLSIAHVYDNNVLELIAQYCDSLNCLSLKGCSVTDGGVEKLCEKLHSLTELKLDSVNISDEQLENIFISQPKLKSLLLYSIVTLNKPNFDKLNEKVESIYIQYCDHIENDYIIRNLNKVKHLKNFYLCTRKYLRINDLVKTVPQIEHLRIKCRRYDTEELCDIGILKNLQSLHLDVRNSITDNTVAIMAENCHLLENIQFEHINYSPVTSKGIMRLAELPELKKINMEGLEQIINDEVLESLASNGKLTHVNVLGCNNVTDRGAIALLEQCPCLQELHIEYCKITMATLHKAVTVAKARPRIPPLCIYIDTFNTKLRIDASKYENTCLEIIMPVCTV